MTRCALVTGATGYIGGRLVRRLTADGWTVHALLRENSDASVLPASVGVHRIDGSVARLTQIVGDTAPDVVFHLASLYVADHRPDQVHDLVDANILFPTQLAEAMANAGASRLVNTGTASQHSGETGYNPASLYAATKQACGDLLHYFHRAKGLSAVTLKIFDTYGEGDPRRKLVQLLMDAAMSGEKLAMSPGKQVLDFANVDDVVEAFLIAGEMLLGSAQPLFGDFLLSGDRVSIQQLVAMIETATGRTVHAQFGVRPYREREIMVPTLPDDNQRLPGWRPRHTLADGLLALAMARLDPAQV